MSKARTRWYHHDKGSGGTFIRAGYVRNAASDSEIQYEHDCIRLQIRSGWEGQDDIDICVRIDEAASIASGLALIVSKMSDGTCGKRALTRHARAVESNSL